MRGFLPGQNLVKKPQEPRRQNQAEAGPSSSGPGGRGQGGWRGQGRPEPILVRREPGTMPAGGWFLVRNYSMLQIGEHC